MVSLCFNIVVYTHKMYISALYIYIYTLYYERFVYSKMCFFDVYI